MVITRVGGWDKRLKQIERYETNGKILTLAEKVLRLLSNGQYASVQLGSASAREEERLDRIRIYKIV